MIRLRASLRTTWGARSHRFWTVVAKLLLDSTAAGDGAYQNLICDMMRQVSRSGQSGRRFDGLLKSSILRFKNSHAGWAGTPESRSPSPACDTLAQNTAPGCDKSVAGVSLSSTR